MQNYLIKTVKWIIKSPRRLMIFIILYKPLLYCDIKTALGLNRNDKVDELKELAEKKLLVCKTSWLRKGRLYGLTMYGRRIRKILLGFLDEGTKKKLMGKLGINKIEHEYKESKEIENWETYARIDVSKKQLKPLLEVLDVEKKVAKQINSEFKEKTGKKLSVGNLNTFLMRLTEMKVAEAEKKGMHVFHNVTREGTIIKEQLQA